MTNYEFLFSRWRRCLRCCRRCGWVRSPALCTCTLRWASGSAASTPSASRTPSSALCKSAVLWNWTWAISLILITSLCHTRQRQCWMHVYSANFDTGQVRSSGTSLGRRWLLTQSPWGRLRGMLKEQILTNYGITINLNTRKKWLALYARHLIAPVARAL